MTTTQHRSGFIKFSVSSLLGLIGLFALARHLAAAEAPDYKAIAERVVGQCAKVQEGDRVVIQGDIRDMDLIEEIALAVAKRGGEPLQIVGREKAQRRYFTEVPQQFDTTPPALALKLVEAQTVGIDILGQEFPALLKDVPPERLNAVVKRVNDVFNARIQRGVRSVQIGNGLYPTEPTAKQYGLTKDQLAELFWGGINVDYSQLQATAAAVRSLLATGKEVHVTHPNGTDLTFRIEGRPVFVNDGSIPPDVAGKGGPASQVYLPAGEAYVTPVSGTAEGKIVFDYIPFDDGAIIGGTLIIKGGKMVEHSAQPGPAYERWKALYEAAPEGKNVFAFLDIGLNPNVKVPPGSKLTTWVPAGSVNLGIGDNVWAGGTNGIGWGTGGALNGCSLTVDGKLVVEKGRLTVR